MVDSGCKALISFYSSNSNNNGDGEMPPRKQGIGIDYYVGNSFNSED